MIKLAFAQQKGGVGKSTCAIHMAVELMRRKKRVALLDLDQQGTVTKWAKRRDTAEPRVIHADATSLPRILTELEGDGVDYVLMDLPGQFSSVVNMGMKAADFVIVPSRAMNVDVEASVETVRAAQRLGRPYAFAMVIVQAGSPRTKEFADGLTKQGQVVLPAFVSARVAFPDAIDIGKGVSEVDPKGKAAGEIAALTNAVLRKVVK